MNTFFISILLTIAITIGNSKIIPNFEAYKTENHKFVQKQLEILKNDKHDKFFKKFTKEEQNWVIRLAFAHEAKIQREHYGGFIPSNTFPKISDTNVEYIPKRVMDEMLNGKFSSEFQKNLIDWVKNEWGFENIDFVNYEIHSNEICKEDGTNCLSISGVGGVCCPFG